MGETTWARRMGGGDFAGSSWSALRIRSDIRSSASGIPAGPPVCSRMVNRGRSRAASTPRASISSPVGMERASRDSATCALVSRAARIAPAASTRAGAPRRAPRPGLRRASAGAARPAATARAPSASRPEISSSAGFPVRFAVSARATVRRPGGSGGGRGQRIAATAATTATTASPWAIRSPRFGSRAFRSAASAAWASPPFFMRSAGSRASIRPRMRTSEAGAPGISGGTPPTGTPRSALAS